MSIPPPRGINVEEECRNKTSDEITILQANAPEHLRHKYEPYKQIQLVAERTRDKKRATHLLIAEWTVLVATLIYSALAYHKPANQPADELSPPPAPVSVETSGDNKTPPKQDKTTATDSAIASGEEIPPQATETTD